MCVDVCLIRKTTVLFICINKRVKSIVFAAMNRVISDLKICFVSCIKNWMFCWENLIRIRIFLKLYSSLLFKKNPTDHRMYFLKNVKNDVPFVLPSGLRREDMCGLSRRNLKDREYFLIKEKLTPKKPTLTQV